MTTHEMSARTTGESNTNSNSEKYVNSGSAFKETLRLFKNYTGYTGPMSFDLWSHLQEDYKAAVLFVQFYNQILLAYYKLRTPAAIEEDCVEEVIQYLIKNVPIIEENPARFSPKYIYRISWNAIYCKSVDPYSGQTAQNSWFNNTTSPYIETDEGESCIFDFVRFNDDDMDDVVRKEKFWSVVHKVGEDLGDEAQYVINNICGGCATGGSFRKNMKVSEKRRRAILDEIRARIIELVGDTYFEEMGG